MTKEEAKKLAKLLDGTITGIGVDGGSDEFSVTYEVIHGKEYFAYVSVCKDRNDDGNMEYNVYSIASEFMGDPICDPEWETVEYSISALADYLMELANVVFTRAEMERYVENSELD